MHGAMSSFDVSSLDAFVNWDDDLVIESKRTTSTYFTRHRWCLIALTSDGDSSLYIHTRARIHTHVRLPVLKDFYSGNLLCHMGLSRLSDGSDADLYARRECQTVGLINWQYITIYFPLSLGIS